jgi:hypothetical protein
MIIDRENRKKDMAGTNNTVIIAFSITMFLLLILLLVLTYNSKCQIDNVERFYSNSIADKDMANRNVNAAQGLGSDIKASDPLGNEVYKPVQQPDLQVPDVQDTQVASQCMTRDRLTSADLLPLDANSKWAELNPQCAGDIQDQNYLTAGYHIGINTVGQSMRNANLQLRYEPPNPQIPVSPWLISTIEPDSRVNGLLDIGSAPVYS